MAQKELPSNYSAPLTQRRALLLSATALLLGGCQKRERPIGFSLLFLNHGKEFIVVHQFDPDGQRGPVPGGLGVSKPENRSVSGKQMSFMPGDIKRPVPQWVQVSWKQHDKELKAYLQKYNQLPGEERYTDQVQKEYEEQWARSPSYTQRVDLTPILTPELIAQARANYKTTNLLLTVIFMDDKVTIEAELEKWRKL